MLGERRLDAADDDLEARVEGLARVQVGEVGGFVALLVVGLAVLLPVDERAARVKDFVKRLRWKGPVFEISALARSGLEPRTHAIYEHVATTRPHAAVLPDERLDDDGAESGHA